MRLFIARDLQSAAGGQINQPDIEGLQCAASGRR
jgi:hypothetical protein